MLVTIRTWSDADAVGWGSRCWPCSLCHPVWCVVVQIDTVNSHGCTPLHLACNHGHEGVVSILLQHGASVNPLNDKGQVRH